MSQLDNYRQLCELCAAPEKLPAYLDRFRSAGTVASVQDVAVGPQSITELLPVIEMVLLFHKPLRQKPKPDAIAARAAHMLVQFCSDLLRNPHYRDQVASLLLVSAFAVGMKDFWQSLSGYEDFPANIRCYIADVQRKAASNQAKKQVPDQAKGSSGKSDANNALMI